MGIMKPRSDFHVHTRVSGCCKESYDILDAWAHAKSRGIERLAITDHDVPFKNGFVEKHAKHAREHAGLLIGMEVTMRDGKGGIQVSKKKLDQLDILVLSEHVHVMPFHTIFKRARRAYVSWWQDTAKRHRVDTFYNKIATMSAAGIERHRPDILAHPWRFPWHRGYLDIGTIEAYEPVLAAAARMGTRIEFSRIVMTMIGNDIDGTTSMPDLPSWRGMYQHEMRAAAPFFAEFFTRCKDHGLKLALGSDAHKLADVGTFPDLERAMKACNIPATMIDQDIVSRLARH